MRIKKSIGKDLPYSEEEFGDGRIFYIVNTDLRRVKLTGKRTGSPIPLNIPNSVKREPLVINSELKFYLIDFTSS